MAQRKAPTILDAVLDQLLAGGEAKDAFGRDGLLDALNKALAERALGAEMDHHLAAGEPDWGPRKAAEIQHDDVDRLLRQIAGGTPGKRGRKPTPVRANRVGEILRKMFNLAIRWRIRADNPAAARANLVRAMHGIAERA